ncbi:hypothetical protein Peur_007426 [Populus x canadensis]
MTSPLQRFFLTRVTHLFLRTKKCQDEKQQKSKSKLKTSSKNPENPPSPQQPPSPPQPLLPAPPFSSTSLSPPSPTILVSPHNQNPTKNH